MMDAETMVRAAGEIVLLNGVVVGDGGMKQRHCNLCSEMFLSRDQSLSIADRDLYAPVIRDNTSSRGCETVIQRANRTRCDRKNDNRI